MTASPAKNGAVASVVDYWRNNYLFCELVLAVLVGAGLAVWCEFGSGRAEVSGWLKNVRPLLYPAIVSAFGSLFGFVITAMSIILTWVDKEKFIKLRGMSGYRDFWPTFIHAVYALGAGTIVAVVALVVDQDSSEARLVWYVGTTVVLLACFRLARCVWILQLLINVFAHPIDSDEADGR